jgi:ribose transport system permease protein
MTLPTTETPQRQGRDGGEGSGATGSGRLLAMMRVEREHRLLERYTGVILLIALFFFFAVTQPSFLTSDNLIGVLSNQAIAGIVALGLLVPLATGVFDISIGGMMTLAVVLSTWLFKTTEGSIPIPLAIAITLAVGVLVGLANAGLVVGLGVDSFIATIGTSTLLIGVSQAIANGSTIAGNIPTGFLDISRTEILGRMPLTVVYLAVLAILAWYVLDYTPVGRKVYATGANADASRLAGVRVGRVTTGAFVFSALAASIAGILYASRLGSGPPEIGASYLLPSFSFAFLGSTMIKPGRFNVPGLIVAMFIIAVGINGLQLDGVEFWITQFFQGGALLIAVIISQLRRRRG